MHYIASYIKLQLTLNASFMNWRHHSHRQRVPRDGSYPPALLICLVVFVHLITDEDQETSGDFGSGGAVILLDDQEEEEPSQSGRSRQKKRRGRIHPRGAIEDDEDEEDDKDDEIGYVW